MTWDAQPATIGLMFITVDVGVSGMGNNAAGVSAEQQVRAIVETVVIGAAAAYLAKSWWPIVGPLAYLAFDYAWSQHYGHAPEVGASEDKDVYENGR